MLRNLGEGLKKLTSDVLIIKYVWEECIVGDFEGRVDHAMVNKELLTMRMVEAWCKLCILLDSPVISNIDIFWNIDKAIEEHLD